jgi:hypothetical protein
MATRTISNAGGNWNATATWAEGIVPTAADEVVATATSGNLTINTNCQCRSADFTNYTGTLVHGSGYNWTIGDATLPTGNVALKFSAGMTYTKANNTATITFGGTAVGIQTITFAGKTVGNIVFSTAGNAASWQLQDAMTGMTAATLTHSSGNVDTNSQNVSMTTLLSSGTATRSLTLGASQITLSGGGTTVVNFNATGLTFNAGTSTITLTGAGTSTFTGGGKTFGSVVITGAGIWTVTGTNTFANFTRTGTAVKTDELRFTDNQTITGTLTLNGNGAINRLYVRSTNYGTPVTLTAASELLTWVDFRDIVGAGAAAPFSGTSIGDALGNSGIDFTPSVTRYWIGATGNWSDVLEWSASSGGGGGASVPLPQDDAVFDVNSGAGTVSVDVPRICRSLSVTADAATTQLTLGLGAMQYLFGSLSILKASLTFTSVSFSGLYLMGRGSHSINVVPSFSFAAGMNMTGIGGTYTLTGDLDFGDVLYLTGGTFDAAGFDVMLDYFDGGGGTSGDLPRTVLMGSGTWTITTGFGWNTSGLYSANLVLDAQTSTVVFAKLSYVVTSQTVVLKAGQEFYDVVVTNLAGADAQTLATTCVVSFTSLICRNFTASGSAAGGPLSVTFADAATIEGTLSVDSAVDAYVTLTLAATLTVVGAWDVNGVEGAYVVLQSSVAGTRRTINLPAGTINSPWVSIKDIYASSPSVVAGAPIPSVRDWTIREQATPTQQFPVDIPADAKVGDHLFVVMYVDSGSIGVNAKTGWIENMDLNPTHGQYRVIGLSGECKPGEAGTTITFNASIGVDVTSVSYCFAVKDARAGNVLQGIVNMNPSGSPASYTGPTQTTTVASLILDVLTYQTVGSYAALATPSGGGSLLFNQNSLGNEFHTFATEEQQAAPGLTSARTITPSSPPGNGFFSTTQVAFRPSAPVYVPNSIDAGGNAGWDFGTTGVSGTPAVTITAPLEGATVNGTIPLEAEATDPDGIASWAWEVDGVPLP